MEPESPHSLYQAALEKAEHFRQLERYDLAEKTLHESLAHFPHDANLLGILAQVYLQWEKPDEAERCAQEGLAQDPNHGLLLVILGDVRAERGANQEAEKLYLNALRQDPNHSFYLLKYGVLLFRVGHLDKAEAVIRRSLAQNPEDAQAHSLLSVILARKQKGAEAIESGSLGLQLAPDADVSHASMGATYYQGGRPFLARRHLREALRLDPDDEDVRELYRQVDFHTRWTSILFYYWSWIMEKIPGQQFTLWGIFVAGLYMLRRWDDNGPYSMWFALSYLALVVYTWLAIPVTKLWIKVKPAP